MYYFVFAPTASYFCITWRLTGENASWHEGGLYTSFAISLKTNNENTKRELPLHLSLRMRLTYLNMLSLDSGNTRIPENGCLVLVYWLLLSRFHSCMFVIAVESSLKTQSIFTTYLIEVSARFSRESIIDRQRVTFDFFCKLQHFTYDNKLNTCQSVKIVSVMRSYRDM